MRSFNEKYALASQLQFRARWRLWTTFEIYMLSVKRHLVCCTLDYIGRYILESTDKCVSDYGRAARKHRHIRFKRLGCFASLRSTGIFGYMWQYSLFSVQVCLLEQSPIDSCTTGSGWLCVPCKTYTKYVSNTISALKYYKNLNLCI